MENSSILWNTGAEILAVAVCELFPNVELVYGGKSVDGFFYEFVFPFDINPETLFLIQQKMSQIVKERRKIQKKEMIFRNAREYLQFLGQWQPERFFDWEENSLVTLFQMENFSDLTIEEDFLKDSGELSFFQLFKIEKTDQQVRIEGSAFFDKKELKEHVKKRDLYEKHSHQVLGKREHLFDWIEGECFWFPKGLLLRKNFLQLWQKKLEKRNFLFVQTPDVSNSFFEEDGSRLQKGDFYEKLFRGFFNETLPLRLSENYFFSKKENGEKSLFLTGKEECLREQIFCLESQLEEECISSLQFILEMLKIFQFTYSIVFYPFRRKGWDRMGNVLERSLERLEIPYFKEKGGRTFQGPFLEVNIADGMGRNQIGFVLGIFWTPLCEKETIFYSKKEKEKVFAIERCSILEKWIGLILETPQGEKSLKEGKFYNEGERNFENQ